MEKDENPDDYEWYEIQDTIDYYEEFEKPKIFYPEIAAKKRNLLWMNKDYYANNKCYHHPKGNKFLLGILNAN